MTAINWKKGPNFKILSSIGIPPYETHVLDNGIALVAVNAGTQAVVKFEIIFRGGRHLEKVVLANKFATALIREGTTTKTSAEIAESVDFYGAHLRTGSNLDYSYLTLTATSKQLPILLPLLADVLYHPTFDQVEIDKFKKSALHRLEMDLSKNEFLNYRIFTEKIFGSDHVYGYNTDTTNIQAITQQDIVTYYHEAFADQHCFMVVAGMVDASLLKDINQCFGQHRRNSTAKVEYIAPEVDLSQRRYNIETANEFQACIRIGRRMFNRWDADYAKCTVMNTILGGYFGSRLMTKIREEMGLTYNIYSAIDTLVYDGMFYVETEVSVDKVEETIHEIYNQIDLLQNEIVGADELSMVKNYLIGNFLNLVDGPLNVASLLRSLLLDNVSLPQFHEFVEELRQTTTEDIQRMAQKYLKKEDLIEVVVLNGKINH